MSVCICAVLWRRILIDISDLDHLALRNPADDGLEAAAFIPGLRIAGAGTCDDDLVEAKQRPVRVAGPAGALPPVSS